MTDEQRVKCELMKIAQPLYEQDVSGHTHTIEFDKCIEVILDLIRKAEVEAEIKAHEEYVGGYHCGYELYAENRIEELKDQKRRLEDDS